MSLGAAPSGPLFCQHRMLLAVTGCDPQRQWLGSFFDALIARPASVKVLPPLPIRCLSLDPCALDCSCLSDCTLCFQVVHRKPHAAGYPVLGSSYLDPLAFTAKVASHSLIALSLALLVECRLSCRLLSLCSLTLLAHLA